MDANKLKKLKEMGYAIKRVCANCKHSQIFHMWGTCSVNEYNHLKHSVSKRQLSISAHGYCPGHEWSDEIVAQLHAFTDLREE